MPAKRKKAPLVKKRMSNSRVQKGKISEKYIFGIVAVLIIIIGLFFWQPWKSLQLPFIQTSSVVTVLKPTMDFGRARQMTIYPEKDNVMQIITQEKVRVTLEVPKGAVKEKTVIKLIPFFHTEKSDAPTSGVAVGPAKVSFSVPVTLSFNFSESTLRNQAPKTAVEKKIRTTGLSQVLQIDANATSFTPTLIARGIETETYLPARILSGGAYVFSLDGKNQIAIAKKALSREKMHTLTVMESATTLLFHDEKLSSSELQKTKAAVAKILSKPTPPAFELFAALILQKKIQDNTFSFIPKAFAYETGEGFYQAVCRDDRYSVEEYLGFAKAAQLMGHDTIGESCLNKAKNKVEQEAKKILGGNPDVKSIMIILHDVQLLGLDDETNLDEQLIEKAKEVATQDAKKVADDPNSTAIQAAIEMQKMEALGADSGPTYEKLKKRITDILDEQEKAAEQANENYQKDEAKREAEMNRLSEEAEKEEQRLEKEYEDSAIQEEEILNSAAMSALGVGLLKAFGFEELDQASLKRKFDEMSEQTKMLASASYDFCVGMRAEGIDAGNCEEQDAKIQGMIQEAEAASYRAEQEIGSLQSQAYENPEYLENQGEVSIYFEEDLTPTPEDEQGSEDSYEVSSSDPEEVSNEETNNSYDYDSSFTDDSAESEDSGSDVSSSEE